MSKKYKTIAISLTGEKHIIEHEFSGGSDRECRQACVNSAKRQTGCDKKDVKVLKL